MDDLNVIVLVVIGLLTGVVGGLLGVGGSIVLIPAITEVLGPDQHLYQATAMIVNFFVVVPAVYQHARAKAINIATVVRIVPLAVLAVLAGVGISELPVFSGAGEVYLRAIFGGFILLVAAIDLARMFRPRRANEGDFTGESNGSASSVSWRLAAVVAVPTGVIAGWLGVGGGIVAVPLQHRFLRLPMRTAIANSATIIVATSLVGAIAKNYAYAVETGSPSLPIRLASVLIPTAIVGSLIGSRMTHRIPLRVIKSAFFVLLIVAGGRLVYSSMSGV